MSWSVDATGKPAEAKAKLDEQFVYPLADVPVGLADEGEKATVRLVSALITQCLETFDPEQIVRVGAAGHMGFKDWTTKGGKFQTVTLAIRPV